MIASRDSPLATIVFLAQNHWDGYVGGTYFGVFAGVDRHEAGRAPEAAVAVFQYPGAHEVGIYHPGTGRTPLRITSAEGDVLTLTDGHAHPVRFDVVTRSFTAVSTQTADGCSPTGTSMPKSAFHARIGDVDGDGRGDVEWALLTDLGMEFGITTASGATVSAVQEFAGGGTRSFVVAQLSNGVVAAITSEQRDSPLYAFVDCRFVVPIGQGDPDIGDSGNGRFVFISGSSGGAAGCSHGILSQYRTRPAARGTEDVLGTPITVSKDGRRATRGPTGTLVRALDVDTHPAEARHYFQVTCGSATVLHPHR